MEKVLDKQTTLHQKLAQLKQNRIFEMTVIAVIILSALEIGVKTYALPEFAHSILGGLDILITLFFLFEISVRFLAEENKGNFFRSGWNLFDSAIVIISLMPFNDSEMALLARLVRIFRVMRMVSVLPELRLLINSLLKALPQLFYVLLLMFIIFYIYAAVGSYLFEPINETLWGNISISMLTLFRVMTFEDWTDVMYETMTVHPSSWLFYVSFIFLTAFAFLNMVIGIVVGVMDEERKALKQDEESDFDKVSQQLQQLNERFEQLQAQLAQSSGDRKHR